MKKNTTPFALALGTSLVSGLMASQPAQAESQTKTIENPFALTELNTGYMHLAEADKDSKEMSCGEGKCGGNMAKGGEEKNVEGNCAGNKPMPKSDKEASCGEGKCGEGKCGSKNK